MTVTAAQKTAIDIVGTFENGKPAQFGKLVVIPGDSGEISGGLFMASMASGNLGKLLQAYAAAGGTLISAAEIAGVVAKNPAENTDPAIKAQFASAATETLMQTVQYEFFGDQFVTPAQNFCTGRKFTLPLTLALVLDGIVHGHFYGSQGLGTTTPRLTEKDWVKAYVAARKAWLQNNPNPVLHNCVYRMSTFETLIANDNWNLVRPIAVHGFTLV